MAASRLLLCLFLVGCGATSPEQEASSYEEIRAAVGPPLSSWVGNSWFPSGGRLYNPDELVEVFSRHCTLFVGDSLQRRARDTLYFATFPGSKGNDTIRDIPLSSFPDKYFLEKRHDHGYTRRDIGRSGCIDMDWRPLLQDVVDFVDDYRNATKEHADRFARYDRIVVGSTIWDVVGKKKFKTSANMLRTRIRETLIKLDSLGLPVFYKTSGWCHTCPWTPKDQYKGLADNYKVWAANDEAVRVARTLKNIHIVDWGTEVLARSIGDNRILSGDNNPYHYGIEARLQFIQMLAAALDQGDTEFPQRTSSDEYLVNLESETLASVSMTWFSNVQMLSVFAVTGAYLLVRLGRSKNNTYLIPSMKNRTTSDC